MSLRAIRPHDPEIPDERFDPDAIARANGETPPPDAPVRDRRRVYSLADLANLKSAAEDYVVGGGIGTRGGKVLIHAQAGKGKTTFADHLVASLASGRAFLGKFRVDRPYRVGVIQAELVESELASHGQGLLPAFGATAAVENLEFMLDTQLRLPRHRDEVRQIIRERRWEVICLDPALEFFEGESSDKAEQVGKMLTAIDWLIEQEHLALAILIHHQNVAGGRTSGSWKFEGWPSTILRLEPVPGVPTDRMLVFEKVRAPGFGHTEKMQLRLSEAGYLPSQNDESTRCRVAARLHPLTERDARERGDRREDAEEEDDFERHTRNDTDRVLFAVHTGHEAQAASRVLDHDVRHVPFRSL